MDEFEDPIIRERKLRAYLETKTNEEIQAYRDACPMPDCADCDLARNVLRMRDIAAKRAQKDEYWNEVIPS